MNLLADGLQERLDQRDVDDARLHLGRDRRRAPGPRCVLSQRVDAAVEKPLAPPRDLAPIQIDFDRDLVVLPATGGQKNQSGTLLKPGVDPAALGQRPQFTLCSGVQFNRLRNSHRSSPLGRWNMPRQLSSATSRALH